MSCSTAWTTLSPLSPEEENISCKMISSSSMDVAMFSQPPTHHNNSYIHNTSNTIPQTTINAMFTSMEGFDQSDMMPSCITDTGCEEVSSSVNVLPVLNDLEVLSEGNLLPLPESSGMISPNSFESTTCIPLTNLRPHSAYSDVSSQSGRDDASSPTSLISYDSQTSSCPSNPAAKRMKKGPAPRQQEDLCLVCGDRASGYHYNALTCEGCKGFFRRSITKKAVYTCKYGTNCEIDMYMRRKCQECRFKKCIAVGMREDCVVPEGTCIKNREKKKAREREKTKLSGSSPRADSNSSQLMSPGSMVSPNSAMSPGITTSLSPSAPNQNNTMINTTPDDFKSDYIPNNSMKEGMQTFLNEGSDFPLTNAQADLINRLLYTQELFELPTNENHKGYDNELYMQNPDDAKHDSNKSIRFSHITSMTIVTVQLIVEFAKRVPGFDTLKQNDQIALLKACTSEVIMLRAARRYDSKTDSIVFGNNFPYKREAYALAGMVPDITDELFNFCAKMTDMRVDNAEYALLTAISIYSDRTNLAEPDKVERLQHLFVETLRSYTNYKQNRQAAGAFGKLLSILVELRTLAHLNNKQCYTIKKDNTLPEFLLELWDLKGGKKEDKDE